MKITDRGNAIELRADSPDASVPSGGELVGYARKVGGLWKVMLRGGTEPMVCSKEDALAILRDAGAEIETTRQAVGSEEQ